MLCFANRLAVIFLLLIVLCLSGRGKPVQTDSLQLELSSANSDSARFGILMKLFNIYRRTNPDTALFYATQGLEISRRSGDTNNLAFSFYRIGTIHKFHGDYPLAMEKINKAMELYLQIGYSHGVTNCLMEICSIYLKQQNFDKALENLLMAQQQPEIEPDQLSRVYSMMGGIYSSQEKYDKALEYHQLSYDMNEKLEFALGMSANLNNIGNVKLDLKEYEEAISYYNRALKIKREINDLTGEPTTLNNIGLAFTELKDFNKAIEYHSQALKLFTQLEDNYSIVLCLTNLGYDHKNAGHYEQAIRFANKGIALADSLKLGISVKEGYLVLSESYAALNRFEKAYTYFRLYKSYNDSVLNNEVSQTIASIESKYELDKKEKELMLMNADKEKQDLQLHKKTAQQNLLIVLIIFVLAILAFLLASFRTKQKINKKLKQINESKSRFFANISHEIRTPLTLLLGPLEILQSHIIKEKDKSLVRMMYRNTARLLSLNIQLLDLSKLESGKLMLQVMHMNVSESLKGMCASYGSLADKKKINFVTNFPDDDIYGWIDGDKFEKIVFNLLGNAFKFTPETGRISITATTSPATLQKGKGNQIELFVEDTGVGIAPEHLPMVFDRFFQVDASTSRRYEGTGLGLALSKELVELHHGDIAVESIPDKGSKFRVILPIDKENYKSHEIVLGQPHIESDFRLPEEEIPIQDANPDLSPAKQNLPEILIVEDNDDMRKFIRHSLQDNFQIIEAPDGFKAFTIATDRLPELIITDLMMPGMDGIELCEKLKTDQLTSHIPIILLTALADVEKRIKAFDTGADEYLTKPFNRKELRSRINNLIHQRQQLRARFLQANTLVIKSVTVTSSDEIFMKKLISFIDGHMPDPDLNVDSLLDVVHLSRSQLHRKLKALTALSSTEFIRNIRLKRAAQLLGQHQGSVAETAYAVGFNNLSYFSKCFQKQFNLTPKEYIERHSNTE